MTFVDGNFLVPAFHNSSCKYKYNVSVAFFWEISPPQALVFGVGTLLSWKNSAAHRAVVFKL